MTNYLTTSAWKTFWKNMRLLSLGPEIFCTSLHVVFTLKHPCLTGCQDKWPPGICPKNNWFPPVGFQTVFHLLYMEDFLNSVVFKRWLFYSLQLWSHAQSQRCRLWILLACCSDCGKTCLIVQPLCIWNLRSWQKLQKIFVDLCKLLMHFLSVAKKTLCAVLVYIVLYMVCSYKELFYSRT